MLPTCPWCLHHRMGEVLNAVGSPAPASHSKDSSSSTGRSASILQSGVPVRVKRLIATQIPQLTCHQIHLPSGNLRAIGVSNQCNYAGVIWKPWQPARLNTQNPKPKQSDGGRGARVCVLLLNSERGENCQLNNVNATLLFFYLLKGFSSAAVSAGTGRN